MGNSSRRGAYVVSDDKEHKGDALNALDALGCVHATRSLEQILTEMRDRLVRPKTGVGPDQSPSNSAVDR